MWRSVSPLVPGLAHAHHHHHTHTTEASAASASERSAQRNSRGPFLQHGTPELAWGSCALRLAIRALHGRVCVCGWVGGWAGGFLVAERRLIKQRGRFWTLRALHSNPHFL
jgi:hypothetical protein